MFYFYFPGITLRVYIMMKMKIYFLHREPYKNVFAFKDH